jgi:hypothetical protein
MSDTLTSGADRFDRLVTLSMTGLAVLAAIIQLLHVLTHFPFFDETLHVRYLWLFSMDLRPEQDFFCIYPALGYLMTLPFMRLFPESAFVVLALRCLSLVATVLLGLLFYHHGQRNGRNGMPAVLAYLLIVTAPPLGVFFSEYSIDHPAAFAAIAAMLLFFGEPRLSRIGSASALTVLSVVIMPKYPLPLFLGMGGLLAAYYRNNRGIMQAAAAAAAGALSALALVWTYFFLNNASLYENIIHSHVLQYRWSRLTAFFGFHGGSEPLIVAVAEFFRDNPAAAVLVALGVAGWARRSWRNPDGVSLGGAGVLLGTLISAILVKDFHAQYLAPVVLCLALFVPYAPALHTPSRLFRVATAVLLSLTLVILSFRMAAVAREFQETPFNVRAATRTAERSVDLIVMAPPAMSVLNEYEELLKMIPRDERVVAMWPEHPLFRRDVGVFVHDEKPSYFTALSEGDPLRKQFDPKAFRRALDVRPPALFSPLGQDMTYPPGYVEEIQDFLARHRDLYIVVRLGVSGYVVRRDLVKGLPRGAR